MIQPAQRFCGRVAAACLGAALALPVLAADVAPSGRGIPTMTRGMKIFGDAEARLVDAMKSRDAATLDELVDPLFEQRGQAEPGTPLPREDWVAQAAADAAGSVGVRQMAVHDHGDLAVVSYLWERGGARGNAFVVDVWKRKSPDVWVLVTRYLSRAAAPAAGRRAKAPAVDPKK